MSDTRAESIAIVLVGAGGLGREVLNYVLEAIRPSPHMRLRVFWMIISAVKSLPL